MLAKAMALMRAGDYSPLAWGPLQDYWATIPDLLGGGLDGIGDVD